MSMLNKWITAHRDTDVVSKEDLGVARENDRLRRENRILKEERDILKKPPITRQAIATQSAERGIVTISSTLRQTCWIVTSRRMHPTRNGQAISAMYGPARGGFILR